MKLHNAVSSVFLAKFLCPRQGQIVSTLLHKFTFHLEVTCILCMKIDSSVLLVMEEHRGIVQHRPISNLLRSTTWITSGLTVVFQTFARNLAIGFPVAHHRLALLREEVE